MKTLRTEKRWEEKLLQVRTNDKYHMNALMDLSRKRMVKRSEDG